MATIEERLRGGTLRYRVLWRQRDTTDGPMIRQQQTYTTRAEAEAFQQRVEAYGNKWPPGEDPRPQRLASPLTFGVWALRAVDARPRASERTKADYRRDLDNHMLVLRDVPLTELTAVHVQAWMRTLTDRDKPLSDKTVRNLHGFASSVMQDALTQHPPLAAHNPFLGRIKDSATVRTEEMVFLTPQEFGLVLGHIRAEYRDLFQVLFSTGLRYGEATALTVGDVELMEKRKTLTVTKAWKRTGPASWEVGEPKTRRSRRTLSLSPKLVDLLVPLVVGRKSHELLFPGSDGGRLPHIEVYKRGWAPAVARARVCEVHFKPQRDGRGQPPLTPKPCDCDGVLAKQPRIHDLRHSHASMLIASGQPLVAISRRLGHSSITITIDRYGHLDPALDDGINEAVDRALQSV